MTCASGLVGRILGGGVTLARRNGGDVGGGCRGRRRGLRLGIRELGGMITGQPKRGQRDSQGGFSEESWFS